MRAESEGGEASSHTLWNQASQEHDKKNWAQARFLWQLILQDEPDNHAARLNAAVATERLVLEDEKLEDSVKATYLGEAIASYNKLFVAPQANDEVRSRAAAKLIDAYVRAEKLDEAQAIFDVMPGLGDSKTVKEQRARAAVNLIDAYGRVAEPGKARAIFDAMVGLGDSEVVNKLRSRGAAYLIAVYGSAKKFGEYLHKDRFTIHLPSAGR